MRSAFTLIELLVVIAIIAVLAVVVVLVLNPAQLLMQARDSNRLSDLATINSALQFYTEDAAANGAISLGSVSTTYLSVLDPTATSTAGDQCQGLGMPSSSYAWQCAASSSYRTVAAKGWIPVNFSSIQVGSPLGQLPQDPTNQTSSNLFYAYSTDGTKYEVTAVMESQKYKSQLASQPPIPGYPEVAAAGSSYSLSGLWNPSGLVGWWPMDEGSGTVAQDLSGNGNGGTWSGSTPYYAGGKVGSYAGNFDSSSSYVDVPQKALLNPTAALTLTAWINPSAYPGSYGPIVIGGSNLNISSIGGYFLGINGAGTALSFYVNVAGPQISVAQIPIGTWTFIAATMQANGALSLMKNAVVISSSSAPAAINYGPYPTSIGRLDYCCNAGPYLFSGQIDDVRIYNRALSPAEVQALYNAEK